MSILRRTAFALRQMQCGRIAKSGKLQSNHLLIKTQRATKATTSRPQVKLSTTELIKKYGFIGMVVMTVEYIIMWVVLYYACALFSLTAALEDWIGEGTITGWIAKLHSIPSLGSYIQRCKPETVTDICVSGIVNEVCE